MEWSLSHFGNRYCQSTGLSIRGELNLSFFLFFFVITSSNPNVHVPFYLLPFWNKSLSLCEMNLNEKKKTTHDGYLGFRKTSPKYEEI